MEKAQVTKLAREAGFVIYEGEQDRILFEESPLVILARFAELVLAAQEKKEPNITVSFEDDAAPSLSLYVPEAFQSSTLDAIKAAFRNGETFGVAKFKKSLANL